MYGLKKGVGDTLSKSVGSRSFILVGFLKVVRKMVMKLTIFLMKMYAIQQSPPNAL